MMHVGFREKDLFSRISRISYLHTFAIAYSKTFSRKIKMPLQRSRKKKIKIQMDIHGFQFVFGLLSEFNIQSNSSLVEYFIYLKMQLGFSSHLYIQNALFSFPR